MQYQVGGLQKLLLQLEGYRFKGELTDNQIRYGISDEPADILPLVLYISSEPGIDINEAWEKTTASDREKISGRPGKWASYPCRTRSG